MPVMRARCVLSATLAVAGFCLSSSFASATERCVSGKPGCYLTLSAALAAARDGDTIVLGRGTFAGGVNITKSIQLVGAGRRATTISGGGPVVTVGTFLKAKQPTVSISDLTITGGVTTDSPFGPADARGGGIFMPPAKNFKLGATLSLQRVIVTGNRTEPETTRGPESPEEEEAWPQCPEGFCPFAGASGGGIESWGQLTLDESSVTGNESGGIASDADGAGIWIGQGTLLLEHSSVSGNRALAAPPNGRFGEGGGIFANRGALTILGSSISGNEVSLRSELPLFAGGSLIEMNANSGALHAGEEATVTIKESRFEGNSVISEDPHGEAVAFDSGALIEGPSTEILDTVFSGDSVSTTASTSALNSAGGSVLEIDGGGHVSGLRLVENQMSETTVEGAAGVAGALAVLNFPGNPHLLTIEASTIARNTALASHPGGTAFADGGGILNDSLLELDGTVVRNNTAHAEGADGKAQGGGIFNGEDLSGPPVALTLHSSSVTANSVTGSAGIELHGGGIFTEFPVNLLETRVRHNSPDDCAGC
jgi:hypothetical protein